MTLQTGTVTNRVRLSVLQTDKFKTGVLTFTIPFDITRDHVLCTLLLPGVLRRGTEKYPTMAALNRRLDELYASCVEIRTARLGKYFQLVITAEILDESYSSEDISICDGILDVVADTILHPKLTEDGNFPEPTVNQEIRFTKDSINGIINSTRVYAMTRLREIMNRNDPAHLTIEETLEELDHVDGARLADFHRRVCDGSHIDVFYVGSLSFDQLATKLQKHFECSAETVTQPTYTLTPTPSTDYMERSEKMPVSQGKLVMGFRTGTCLTSPEDNLSALVLNELFGGSAASKLFINVREKMSLCYYCSSSYSQYTGVITVSAGVKTKNLPIAREAILQQLEDIQNGVISETELHAAKKSLEHAYRQVYDNPFDLQSFYGNRIALGLPCSLEDCRRAIASVTAEDVIRIAKRISLDAVFTVEGEGNAEDSDSEEEEYGDE